MRGLGMCMCQDKKGLALPMSWPWWDWVVGKVAPGLTASKAEATAAELCFTYPLELCCSIGYKTKFRITVVSLKDIQKDSLVSNNK